MVDAAVRPKTTRTSTDTADANLHIDVARVNDALMGTWGDVRRQAREMIKDSAFWRKDELGKDEHRERVLSQLHLLVQNRAVHRAFPTSLGGEDNNGANIAGFVKVADAMLAQGVL